MKPKFAVLALASSLLSANALAQETAKAPAAVQAPAKGVAIFQPAGRLTIQVSGQTIAVVSLAAQPKDAQVMLSGEPEVVYDQQKGIFTIKGKFTFEITQNGKNLMRIVVADGVAILETENAQGFLTPRATSIVATPFPLPGEDNGGFCGQSQVERMVMNTELGKQMQRQQQEAIHQSQAAPATRNAIPVQPAQPTAAAPQK